MAKKAVEKQENVFKARLAQEMHDVIPNYVVIAPQDVRHPGIPDWATNAFNRTAWWEFKHATPDFESQGIQELTMLRLAKASFARYIIWHEEADGSNKRTLIVHPKDIGELWPEDFCVGFNYRFIVNYIRKVHEGRFSHHR